MTLRCMLNIKALIFFVNFGQPQRLFKYRLELEEINYLYLYLYLYLYTDDNALINLLAPLEIGQETDTAFCEHVFKRIWQRKFFF
jgi:hypothetical protein